MAEYKGETARRAALVAAGNPPPVTYQVQGKQVRWTEYLQAILDQITKINEQINASDEPYEEIVRGYT